MKTEYFYRHTCGNILLGWFTSGSLVSLSFVFLFFIFTSQSSAETISRPYKDAEPTRIQAFIEILDVDDIQSAEQNFHANVYVELSWHDPRLSHDNTGRVLRKLNEIWHPNIQFVNQQKLWSTIPDIVQISPEGIVTYSIRVWGSFSQPLDLREFPFDHQEFTIQLVELVYVNDEVVIDRT